MTPQERTQVEYEKRRLFIAGLILGAIAGVILAAACFAAGATL